MFRIALAMVALFAAVGYAQDTEENQETALQMEDSEEVVIYEDLSSDEDFVLGEEVECEEGNLASNEE